MLQEFFYYIGDKYASFGYYLPQQNGAVIENMCCHYLFNQKNRK